MNFNQIDQTLITEDEHEVKLVDRRNIDITGVKVLDSFDSEEFLMETVQGYLIIRGHQLQLKNLNVEDGIVQIHGKVYELAYVDEQREDRAKGIFSKLFR